MNTPPPDLALHDLAGALQEHWRLEVDSLDYLAVGFGSHHWAVTDRRGERWFATVDDLRKVRLDAARDEAFAALDGAFETARVLSDTGFDAIVAPVATRHGRVLVPVGEWFTVALFPWVDASPASWSEHRPGHLDQLHAVLADLHARTDAVTDVAAREDFVLPCRGSVEDALGDLDGPWAGGPFSEPVRHALGAAEPLVHAALMLYDDLVRSVADSGRPFVVTHGEPHAGNVLWTADGPKLIDWDTVLIAPPERDLWMLGPHEKARRDDRPGVVLYALWWDLAEIGEYVTELRARHEDTEDTREAFANFLGYIDLATNWSHVLTSQPPGPTPRSARNDPAT